MPANYNETVYHRIYDPVTGVTVDVYVEARGYNTGVDSFTIYVKNTGTDSMTVQFVDNFGSVIAFDGSDETVLTSGQDLRFDIKNSTGIATVGVKVKSTAAGTPTTYTTSGSGRRS